MLDFGFLRKGSLADYNAAILSLNPSYYYRMDEATGATNLQSAVSSAPIQLAGSGFTLDTVGLLANSASKAVQWSGGTAYASNPSASSGYLLGGVDWSISLLVSYTISTFSTVLCIRTSDLNSILCLVTTSRISAGDISAETWSWQDINSRVRYPGANTGNPIHVVVNYTQSINTLDLYVNGTLRDSRVQNGGTFNSVPLYLIVGSNWGGAQAFNGKTDELALFNYALQSSQILMLSNIALSGSA
jgi:hypothetical protein